jgi:D-alanine-D-alanine ligase
MRVTILHNFVPPDAPPEDRDTLVEVAAVAESLIRLGHETTTLSCSLDLAAIHEELPRLRPDVVFNLVESLNGADSLVYLPPAVLDVLGIPYCGSRTEALFLTAHKTLAKQRLRQAGLPTPEWIESRHIVHEGHEEHEDGREKGEGENRGLRNRDNTGTLLEMSSLSTLSYPSCPSCSSWIIKGVWDQGSRGIDDDAVVRNIEPAELRRRLADRAARSGQSCFAERFIEGREFNLSVLGGAGGFQTLPPAEIEFRDFPPDKPRIVGHRAKWDEDSFECRNTCRTFDLPAADASLLARLRDLAARCWTLFDLRGWARVDFRVDAAGEPWILEVNANPCISPDAGFAAALERASLSYDDGIRRILEDARLNNCGRQV